MYPPEEAVEMLKLNPETARRFLREERLRGNPFGREWRIPESAPNERLEKTSAADRAEAGEPRREKTA